MAVKIHSITEVQRKWQLRQTALCSSDQLSSKYSLLFPNLEAGEHQGVHRYSRAPTVCQRTQVQCWNNIKDVMHQHILSVRLKATTIGYTFLFSRQFFFIPTITKHQGFSKKSKVPSLLLCQLADLCQKSTAVYRIDMSAKVEAMLINEHLMAGSGSEIHHRTFKDFFLKIRCAGYGAVVSHPSLHQIAQPSLKTPHCLHWRLCSVHISIPFLQCIYKGEISQIADWRKGFLITCSK